MFKIRNAQHGLRISNRIAQDGLRRLVGDLICASFLVGARACISFLAFSCRPDLDLIAWHGGYPVIEVSIKDHRVMAKYIPRSRKTLCQTNPLCHVVWPAYTRSALDGHLPSDAMQSRCVKASLEIRFETVEMSLLIRSIEHLRVVRASLAFSGNMLKFPWGNDRLDKMVRQSALRCDTYLHTRARGVSHEIKHHRRRAGK